MYRKICVTNRKLVEGSFTEQLKKVAESGCDRILLREKDLSEADYEALAKEVLHALAPFQTECVLHTYADVALRLGCTALHLPLAALLAMPEERKRKFKRLGASVHSAEEAAAAEKAGADELIAGHIFATDCKKGLAPRGLSFLQSVCQAVTIPVYAIGGITDENEEACIRAGAAGVCRMSWYMRRPAESPKSFR